MGTKALILLLILLMDTTALQLLLLVVVGPSSSTDDSKLRLLMGRLGILEFKLVLGARLTSMLGVGSSM